MDYRESGQVSDQVKWLQMIMVAEPPLSAEAVQDILMNIGAVSVTMVDNQDQPIFEPDVGTTPLWSDTKIIGLFKAEEIETAEVDEILTHVFSGKPPAYQWEILEDQDWTRAWLKDFKPMQFGRHIWICPTSYEPPQPEALNIMLDPGLAFGTGTHPTTRLCLEWLDEYAAGNDIATCLNGQYILDYGCGSGILGVGAAMMGAARVVGIDIDPQAIVATKDNAQANNVVMEAYLPDEIPPKEADILLANILAGPLAELSGEFYTHLKVGGALVMSGILAEQAEDLKTHYDTAGFDISSVAYHDGWARVVARKI